jgi:hypothetical protein
VGEEGHDGRAPTGSTALHRGAILRRGAAGRVRRRASCDEGDTVAEEHDPVQKLPPRVGAALHALPHRRGMMANKAPVKKATPKKAGGGGKANALQHQLRPSEALAAVVGRDPLARARW